MKHFGTARLAAVFAAACMLLACSSTTGGAVRTASAPVYEQGEQAAIARARADSALNPYTTADIQFMSGMISHHAQAIVMARLAPTHGASGSLQILAERIINAQSDEIRLMQQWLRERRQPVPEATPAPMKMTMNGMEHTMLMPGMLTEAQLKQLDAARDADFDRQFLSFMVQHHRGAVSMVRELFATDGAGQDNTVFKFAADVNVDQSTEIARMERMLFALQLERRSP